MTPSTAALAPTPATPERADSSTGRPTGPAIAAPASDGRHALRRLVDWPPVESPGRKQTSVKSTPRV